MTRADLPDDFPEKCASAFYSELFRHMPALEPMFENVTSKRRMFATALMVILKEADDPEALNMHLRSLGKKHLGLGLLPVHINGGRQVFLAAVEDAAPQISEDELAFFDSAYQRVASAMLGK